MTTTADKGELPPLPEPAETCNYPDCNCPFDAPADPSWCARGLPKANGLDLRAAIDATTKQEKA